MDLAELTLVIKSSQVGQAVNALGRLVGASNSAQSAQSRLATTNSQVENTFNRLTSIIAKASAAFGGFVSISKAISIAADMEQAELAFETMLGSAEKAKKMMEDLKQFAASTPFLFKDLAEDARLLVAMGTAGDKAVPTLRRIGDAAAALGGSSVLMDRIALALGQMQAKGKVAGEEMRQLAEAGIPAYDMLAKAIGVTVPTAMQLVENRAFDGITGVNILLDGMAQRYGGATQRLALSTKGLFSTLKDNVFFTMGDIGQAIIDAFDVKDKLRVAIDLTYTWGQVLADASLMLGGLPPKFNQNIEASQRLATIIKYIGEVLAFIISLKIVELLGSAAIAVVNLSIKIVTLNGYLIPVLSIVALIGTALAAWELGGHLFNEFKAIQIAANTLLSFLEKGWIYVKNAATLAFLGIKEVWNTTMNALLGLFAVVISKIASGFQSLSGVVDKVGLHDQAEGLTVVSKQLDSWAVSMKTAFDKIDTFSTHSFDSLFVVVDRLVNVDGKSEAVKQAWRSLYASLDPKNNTENRPVEEIAVMNEQIIQLVRGLGQEGSKESAIAAQRILEEWQKGLEGLGNLPLSIGAQLANDIRDQQLKIVDEVKAARLQEMDRDFGGSDRKGNTFVDSLSSDLTKLFDTIKKVAPELSIAAGSVSQLSAAVEGAKNQTTGEIEGLQKLKETLSQYRNDVEELTDKYKAEREAVGHGQLQRDLEVQTLKAEQYLLQHHIESKDEMISRLRQEITLLAKARFEHELYNKTLDEQDARIGIGLSDKQAEVEKKLREAQRRADEAGVEFSQAQKDKYSEEINKTYDLVDAWTRWKNASKELAGGIGDTIDSILLRTSSLSDALESLALLVEKIAIQTFISGPLSAGLAGFFQGFYPGPSSAKGNVFSKGEMVSFANGDVFNSRQTFRMRDGRTAEFAENGPEAIAPLGRTASGKLGVHVIGGGGQGGVNIGSINISTPNPDGFRKSESQIARSLVRAARRA